MGRGRGSTPSDLLCACVNYLDNEIKLSKAVSLVLCPVDPPPLPEIDILKYLRVVRNLFDIFSARNYSSFEVLDWSKENLKSYNAILNH